MVAGQGGRGQGAQHRAEHPGRASPAGASTEGGSGRRGWQGAGPGGRHSQGCRGSEGTRPSLPRKHRVIGRREGPCGASRTVARWLPAQGLPRRSLSPRAPPHPPQPAPPCPGPWAVQRGLWGSQPPQG